MITLKEVSVEETKDILETAEKENVFIKANSDSKATIFEITKVFDNKENFHTYLVLDQNKNIVGFISSFPNKNSDTSSLGIMYIMPEARGKGYGKKMVNEYINLYRKLGFKKIFTKTWESNLGSQKIFKELGFKVVERKENDRINGEATVKFLLDLNK